MLAVLVCALVLAGEVAWAKCGQESDEDSVSVLCVAENGDLFISRYSVKEGSFEEHFCLSEGADGFDASMHGTQELQVWAAGRQLETFVVDVFSNPTGVPESSPIAEAYSGYSCGTLALAGETTSHLGWDGMVFSLGGKVSDRIHIDDDVLLAYLSAVIGSSDKDDDSETDTPSGTPDVHLWGGPNRSVYLGCYNCSDYDSDSICNEYGSHGSEYSSVSVWNEFATFGSKYGLSSPWNEYSSSVEVPALVDGDGAFYGYFTINIYRVEAFSEALGLKEFYEFREGDLEEVRDAFCS